MESSKSRLRAVREAKGYSQRQLSAKSGVDIGFISRIERGIQRPSIDTLMSLAKALDLKNVVQALQILED
jgi:transcriptional regulator with XRE-family HTH domain